MPDRKLGDDCHPGHKADADAGRDDDPSLGCKEFAFRDAAEDAAQRVTEEQEEQNANDAGTHDSDVLHHLAKGKPLGGSFGLWELLPEEQESVNRGGDEIQPELCLPWESVAQKKCDECAEDHSSRPARVKDVQVVGAVFWEDSRNQRIRDRFESAVCQRENEGAAEEQIEGGRLADIRSRRQRDYGGQHMECECGRHEFSVADFIHHDAAKNDAKTETRKACAADETDLAVCEAEERFPLSGETVAQCEADAGGEDGHESCEQEPFGVGC